MMPRCASWRGEVWCVMACRGVACHVVSCRVVSWELRAERGLRRAREVMSRWRFLGLSGGSDPGDVVRLPRIPSWRDSLKTLLKSWASDCWVRVGIQVVEMLGEVLLLLLLLEEQEEENTVLGTTYVKS